MTAIRFSPVKNTEAFPACEQITAKEMIFDVEEGNYEFFPQYQNHKGTWCYFFKKGTTERVSFRSYEQLDYFFTEVQVNFEAAQKKLGLIP